MSEQLPSKSVDESGALALHRHIGERNTAALEQPSSNTQLLSRLRTWPVGEVGLQAADEIVRLSQDVARYESGRVILTQMLADADAIIRKERATHAANMDALNAQNANQRDVIEQLRMAQESNVRVVAELQQERDGLRQLFGIDPADDAIVDGAVKDCLRGLQTHKLALPPNGDLVLARNCLGNLVAAVQRFAPIDADIDFAMREAVRFLGEPYTAVTKDARKVGCETRDGLLRIHSENEVCDVCGPGYDANGSPVETDGSQP